LFGEQEEWGVDLRTDIVRLARDRQSNEVHSYHLRRTRKRLRETVYFERFVSSRSVPFNQQNLQSDVQRTNATLSESS
jgi:hypothetical protein